MTRSRTREALGIFWHGEEVDGFLVYGYWPSSGVPEPPLSPRSWSDLVQWSPQQLTGPGWTVWMWEVRVWRWPAPSDWPSLIAGLLRGVLQGGARVAWCGFEGVFVDPPKLFDPLEMSGGVWAAATADGVWYGPPPLDGVCSVLPDDALRGLHERIQVHGSQG